MTLYVNKAKAQLKDDEDLMEANFAEIQKQFEQHYVHHEAQKKVYYQGEVFCKRGWFQILKKKLKSTIQILGAICLQQLNCPAGTVECWKEIDCGGDNNLMQANIKISCLDKNRNELPSPPLGELSIIDLLKECNDGSPLGEFTEFKTELLNDKLEALKLKVKDQISGMLNRKNQLLLTVTTSINRLFFS